MKPNESQTLPTSEASGGDAPLINVTSETNAKPAVIAATPAELMSYEELFSLLKHLDESAHKKEALFLGVSLALVPAVFAAWGSLKVFPTTLAGIASIGFYWLHGLHIARYSANQDSIVAELRAARRNFASVFDVPSSISIRRVRAKMRWVFVGFWLLVFLAKIIELSDR